MPLDRAKFLQDMLDACKSIKDYVAGRTLEDFLNSKMLRDSVHWNFCVIGEAISQLNRLDPQFTSRITDHWKIVGLRNQLIHGYGVVDSRITWNIVEDKLPILIGELEKLLQE
jgi:uncharacterized protein with HEPN domain